MHPRVLRGLQVALAPPNSPGSTLAQYIGIYERSQPGKLSCHSLPMPTTTLLVRLTHGTQHSISPAYSMTDHSQRFEQESCHAFVSWFTRGTYLRIAQQCVWTRCSCFPQGAPSDPCHAEFHPVFRRLVPWGTVAPTPL